MKKKEFNIHKGLEKCAIIAYNKFQIKTGRSLKTVNLYNTIDFFLYFI